MGNILRKQNRMMNFPAVTAGQIPYRNVTVKDKLDELDNRASADTFGTDVDITNYTSENPYIAPYDGYVLGVTSDVGQVVQGCINGIWLIHAYSQTGNRYQKDSVYVKKGMSIYASITNGGELRFYPLEGSALPSAESEGF